MEINDIKIIILDKIQGKSEAQLQLDLLQNEVEKDKRIISSLKSEDISVKIKEAINQLISEGKLIIDVSRDILDK